MSRRTTEARRRTEARPRTPTRRHGLGPGTAGFLAAVAGLFLYLAFPPADLWILAPVALGLLYAASHVRRIRTGALVGALFGAVFLTPLLQWSSVYVGATLPWAALSVVETLYLVGFGLLAAALVRLRAPGPTTALLFAALYVAQEWLRGSWPWGGLPWGLLAYGQTDAPWTAVAPWGGTALIGFVTAAIGTLAAAAVLRAAGVRAAGPAPTRAGRGRAARDPFRARSAVTAAIAAPVVAALASFVPPPAPETPDEGPETLHVAAVQGGLDGRYDRTLGEPGELVGNHARLTKELGAELAASGQELDLLVWPEQAAVQDPAEDPATRRIIDEAVAAVDAPALIGTVRYADDLSERKNLTLQWQAGEGVVDTYQKQRPVPFGEYVPFYDFFRQFTDLVEMVSVPMTAGDSSGVFAIPTDEGTTVPVGNVICFEIAFQDTVAQTVRDGAEVLTVGTNTALFGHSDEAVQQVAQGEIMAQITGRPVVYAATTGPSGIWLPDGTQVASAGKWTSGTLTAEVPRRTDITPAVALGPWPHALAAAAGLAGAAGGLVASRRRVRQVGVRSPQESA